MSELKVELSTDEDFMTYKGHQINCETLAQLFLGICAEMPQETSLKNNKISINKKFNFC